MYIGSIGLLNLRNFSRFSQKVIQVVQSIPEGKVVSYGQVALYVGVPRAARQVGWILRNLTDDSGVPWWRVVNHRGQISIKGNWHADKVMQKKLLQAEGIIIDSSFWLDIEKYRFKADNELLKSWKLPNGYRETVLEKYGL